MFDGLAAFCKVPMKEATADRVWQWLLDSNHVLEELFTRNTNRNAIGLAHVQACPRALGGREVEFSDNLLTEAPDNATDVYCACLRMR